jgi:hypothetical protein
LADTVIVPGVLPPAVTLSQFPPVEVLACALQAMVLLAVTDTVCAGIVAPTAPVKVSDVGLTESGTPCTNVRVTGILTPAVPKLIVPE